MTANDQSLSPAGSSAYPVIRLFAALTVMTIGASGMYLPVLALKPVALTFDVSRGTASIPYMLTMLGFGFGGIMMGRFADIYGVMRPAIFGSLCVVAGFILVAYADSFWIYGLAQGLFVGLFGFSATFAPMIADVSHWFNRRRGLAVSVVISGNYLAGAIWPPIIQYFFDTIGWRETYFGFGIFCLCTMLPLCIILYRRLPPLAAAAPEEDGLAVRGPLGLRPNSLQCLLCAAAIGCCVAMAVPQVHIVAHATDLGHAAQRGAEMLSMMLGFGVISRLLSGWISDHIGGLSTLLLGSSLQALALVLFIPFDGLAALYVLSALFGLSQGGIVPSYAIIVRTYFPPRQAGWRIGAAMLSTMAGMALGGWIAGSLYDLTGSYDVAFINAVAFNIANMAIAYYLLRRRHR